MRLSPTWILLWLCSLFVATSLSLLACSSLLQAPSPIDDQHIAAGGSTPENPALPLISVIIPYKRFERLSLMQAIDSAAGQTYPNVEVVVVGGDAQSTLELRGHYSSNARVSIYPSPQPNGTYAGYTRNLGAYNHSSGQYLAFLDADDAWLTKKLELQYKFAQVYNVLDFSYTEALVARTCRFDSKKKLFTPWNFTLNPHVLKAKGGTFKFPLYNAKQFDYALGKLFGINGSMLPVTFDGNMLNKHNFVITSTVLMSRALFEAAGGFNGTMHRAQDYDLWQRAMASRKDLKAGYFNIPLAIYDWNCHGADGTTNYVRGITTKDKRRRRRY